MENANGNGRANGSAHAHRDVGPGLEDRLPPQNSEAERSLLGSILLGAGREILAELIGWFHVGDFYSDCHQIIYQGMLDLDEQGKPIDVVMLSAWLQRQGQTKDSGGDDYLERCVNAVPHAANYLYYAELIKEHANRRGLIETAEQTIRDGYSNQFTADELLERAARNVVIIEGTVTGDLEDEFALNPPPASMGDAAFQGVVGEIVRRIAPETEACPEAILGQFLVAFGNLIGRRAHWRVNATFHRANLNICLVGATGAGRKGTAWDCTHWLLGLCDPDWARKPVLSGLTSGEGLIEFAKQNPGPVLVVETEFGRFLANCKRENNTLSHVIRQAFDGSFLCVPTRKDALFVADTHISMIGHITYSELLAKITQVDIENGMVNRFLWLHAYRAGSLPEGGNFSSAKQALDQVAEELILSVDFARNLVDPSTPYLRDKAAKKMWVDLYDKLTEPLPGRYGNAVERRAPIVTRLAMIYAVIERLWRIECRHLEAAMAFWNYCDATTKRVFGEPNRDKKLDKLIAFLDNAPTGLTRTQIHHKLGGNHLSQTDLDRLIAAAELTGKYVLRETKTNGRSKHTLIHRKYPSGRA